MRTIDHLLSKHITLSQSKIKELFEDRETNQDLIMRTQIRLIVKLAKQFQYGNKTLEELVSDATLGVIKSIRYYNPNLHTDFTSFTFTTIKQALFKYKDENNIITPSTKMHLNQAAMLHTRKIESMVLDEDSDFWELYSSSDNDKPEFEDYSELCKVIRSVLKESYYEIVVAKLGLCGLNSPVKLHIMAEQFGITKQAINQKYNLAIGKLKNEPLFIKYMTEKFL